ncbi:MAG: hypothetical protein CVU03_01465 [Bacteroidetes bacterium HGW-Bacteroidetes-2]|jgi:hypothetical protein|nr:MAG: hypothetical protein CVU03_01465 [Bacteroidetes bacterium HGW-Bacteroidetes-2]
MRKKINSALIFFLVFIISILVAPIILNPILEKKIKEVIAKGLPEGYIINEYTINVKYLQGSATLENIQASILNYSDSTKNTKIAIKKASINGLSYWKYLFFDEIDLDSIKLKNVNIIAYEDTAKTNLKKNTNQKFHKEISIGKFSMENGTFQWKKTDNTQLFDVDSLHISITDVVINKTTLKKNIPFTFSDAEVKSNALYYLLNNDEALSLKKFSLMKSQLLIKDIAIQPIIDSISHLKCISKKKLVRNIKVSSYSISDFHFKWVDTTFQIFGNTLKINAATFVVHHNSTIGKENAFVKSSENSKPLIGNIKAGFPFSFALKFFKIKNANFTLLNEEESKKLSVENYSLSLKDMVVNHTTIQQKIPYLFSEIELQTGALFYQLNDYDVLSYSDFSLHNHQLQISNLSIQTKYDKIALSKKITKERDHLDMQIPTFYIQNFNFKVVDTSFYVSGKDIIIENPTLKVYRDKSVADDTSIKSLYSESIRNIPFLLTIDSLHIKNASISYEEKVKRERPAGKIYFSNLNAKGSNLSNTYAEGEKETTIYITSVFMEESPLTIDWKFDIKNIEDKFHLKGNLGVLNATKMNSFTKSNLNMNIEGILNKTYFNIHGNNTFSQVDLRLSYDNFKIEILDKKNKKNWLLSSVANIFVKKNTVSKTGTFKEGEATATRNRNKSFFNYLWINIQEGLKQIMLSI